MMFYKRYVVWLVCLVALLGFRNLLAETSPSSSVVDFKSVYEQAIYADAAYLTKAEVQDIVESQNIELTLFDTIEDIQIGYFLVTDKSTSRQIIAIRGTSNFSNALLDIELKLVTDERSGLQFHKGFSFAAEQIFKQIKPFLKPEYKLSLTGHSLGGAVAQILGYYLDQSGHSINTVTTFGQPKVTDYNGSGYFRHLNFTRIVAERDLIPLVPLLDPLDIKDIGIFWHAGREIVLLEDNHFAVLQGINSMLRVTRFTQQFLSEENLNKHLMEQYLVLVEARFESAVQVNYETSFNLFNLFGPTE